MIRAILFDQDGTLWLCPAFCGMNPPPVGGHSAASVRAEGFNPQGCYYLGRLMVTNGLVTQEYRGQAQAHLCSHTRSDHGL
jgi:hypothetical protein